MLYRIAWRAAYLIETSVLVAGIVIAFSWR